jgi:hypothetical protein
MLGNVRRTPREHIIELLWRTLHNAGKMLDGTLKFSSSISKHSVRFEENLEVLFKRHGEPIGSPCCRFTTGKKMQIVEQPALVRAN